MVTRGTVGVLVIALLCPVCEAVVIEHNNDADPLGEGWNLTTGPGFAFGPVPDDLGIQAWYTEVLANGQENGQYTLPVAQEDVALASQNGWRMACRVRVPRLDDEPDGAVVCWYSDGTSRFFLNFGSDAAGNQIVIVRDSSLDWTGTEIALNDSGYHLYEVVYDPGQGSGAMA